MLHPKRNPICNVHSRGLTLGVLLFVALAAPSAHAQTSTGSVIFEKRCYSCHNIGSGDKRGPDLKGVSAQEPKPWLHEFIKSPASAHRRGDPRAVTLFKKFAPEVMPDQDLTDEQIDAILAFIGDVTKSNQAFIPAGARLSRPITPADVQAGWDLFTGRVAPKRQGPACISCHNLEGVGVLGGGTLGPDLTAVNVKYRDPELIALLQNPNFPTMSSVFATHPLADEEVVQVFALLQNAKSSPAAGQPVGATRTEPWFYLIGFSTLVPVLAALNQIWRNRQRGVRKQLLGRTR